MKLKVVVILISIISLYVYGIDAKIEPKAQVYFAQKDDCSKELADRIDKAKKTIYFCTYSLTDSYISASLAKAKKRGLEVAGVAEKQNAGGKGAKYGELLEAGVEIYLDDNSALMHHKFIIIDGHLVGTGSFNWTKAANEKNNENLIFLEGKELADVFYKEFKDVFWKAKYAK